jgi:hypothetical protein
MIKPRGNNLTLVSEGYKITLEHMFVLRILKNHVQKHYFCTSIHNFKN